MEEPSNNEHEIFRVMADDNASRIMKATYLRALSIPQISESCGIPIAVAYRKVMELESMRLLVRTGEVETNDGKKELRFTCAVDSLRYVFEKGTFYCLMCPAENLPFLAMANDMDITNDKK